MMHPDFIKPQYDESCFSNIPNLVKQIFEHKAADTNSLPHGLTTDYDKVVLFFIDAFGWRFVQRYAHKYPVLKQLMNEGIAKQITSQFPSTTAAHVTTIHTGLEVGQHGIYEWFYYEPQIDAMIAPLLFSYAGSHDRETLQTSNVDPRILFPTSTIYQQLQQHGVKSYVFQPQAFAFSSYSRTVLDGATVVPYATFPEALVNLRHLLDQPSSPSYFVLYFSAIDTICHTYGPGSPQVDAEIDTFLTTLDRLFMPALHQQNKTLLILTADHGQVEINPQTTLYLNSDAAFADIQQFMKTNGRGEVLVPGGSPRDMFLYIKEELLDDAHAYVAERMAGRAEVYRADELMKERFFGSEPVSPLFESHVGNLVILPLAGESVWWYERGKFEQTFWGHHGGLTPQEMQTPLLLYSP